MRNYISQPVMLTTSLTYFFDIELDDFPETITSVFGQQINLIDENGQWTQRLSIEHIGYGVKQLNWGKPLHSNEQIEWLLRSWTIERLQLRIDLTPIKLAIRALTKYIEKSTAPQDLVNSLFEWMKQTIFSASRNEQYELSIALRLLYRWALQEGLPGFNEFHQLELESIRLGMRYTPNYVAMRDPQEGPYTRIELQRIENSLSENENVTHLQRTLYLLCRDWGLRPIQIALLKTTDYGCDEVGPYLLVPSVKGIRRSRLRRAPSNLVKRYIADDTAAALVLQCKLSNTAYQAHLKTLTNMQSEGTVESSAGVPIFLSIGKSANRMERLIQNSTIAQYAFHMDSHAISKQLKCLTFILNIQQRKRNRFSEDIGPMIISAYRLRRTKGTSMVLGGATPEEVSEALDHQSVDSVKHYFRYNLDLHDFINKAHANSPEIQKAVEMWRGKFSESYDVEHGAKIAGLGTCTLNSPCPSHPTVSCYACQSFRPDRAANHKAALANIEEFKLLLTAKSTGPLAQQVENAIYGAKPVIIAAAEIE